MNSVPGRSVRTIPPLRYIQLTRRSQELGRWGTSMAMPQRRGLTVVLDELLRLSKKAHSLWVLEKWYLGVSSWAIHQIGCYLRFDLDDRTNVYKPEPWIFVSPILARQQGGIFVHSGCSPLDLRGALSCLGRVWTVGRTGWWLYCDYSKMPPSET